MPAEALPSNHQGHPAGAAAPRPPTPTFEQLWAAALGTLAPTTRKAYQADLERFARWRGLAVADLLADLVAGGPGLALHHLRGWVGDLGAGPRPLAPATINRRISAVTAALRVLHDCGVIPWTVSPPLLPVIPYRDTAGPSLEEVRALLAAAAAQSEALAARDRVILLLLYTCGLRIGEVLGLRIQDWDADRSSISVLGKGRRQRQAMIVPAMTTEAIRAWIHLRDPTASHLVHRLDRGAQAASGGQLTHNWGQHLADLALVAGLRPVRPHGLRHAAVTHLLSSTNGDIAGAAAFARHASPAITQLYDDHRVDRACVSRVQVANLLSTRQDHGGAGNPS
jgi:integrase/recombinase XerC